MNDTAIEKDKKSQNSALKKFLVLPLCAMAIATGYYISERNIPKYFHPHDETGHTLEDYLAVLGPQPLYYKETTAGNYLSGQFAQKRKDWKTASDYLDKILEKNKADEELVKQAMVLAMGSGEVNRAIALARKVNQGDKNNALATLFLIMDALARQDYEETHATLDTVPQKSLGSFITPVLRAWTHAAEGNYKVSDLPLNSLYAYHALLIGTFTGKVDEAIPYVDKSLKGADIDPHDLEKIADLYAHLDMNKEARELYKLIQSSGFTYEPLEQKIAALEKSKEESNIKELIKIPDIQSPEDGAALVFMNMAEILYRDYSDDSALVFANMALHLAPQFSRSRVILGSVLARHERYQEAIDHFLEIDKKDPLYLEAQREAANLYEDIEQDDQAIEILNGLFSKNDDIDALIQIGHLHRRAENYKEALKVYNEAAKVIGDPIPREHWALLYARGMAHEQLKNYKKSEKDLLAALEYQKNHPYILNYLGYSWADQGVNLEKSLDMIKKAVLLKPDDGYIADSLGWVLYRMKEYEQAIPHLERAVELLPYDPVINDHLGDAYWKVGRRIEARFQWDRAYNHAEDEELKIAISDKRKNGLSEIQAEMPKDSRLVAEDQHDDKTLKTE